MFLGHPDPLVRHRDPDPSFYHEAKIVRKTLIPVLFATTLRLFIFENDVNVASESNIKNLKIFLICHLEGH